MKNYGCFFLLLTGTFLSSFAADFAIEENDWLIQYNSQSKSFDYQLSGKTIFRNACSEARYILGGKEWTVKSSDYTGVSLEQRQVNDNFGSGRVYCVKYSDASANVSLEQDIYFYDFYPYLITTLRLVSANNIISSNYLAPVVSNTSNTWSDDGNNNRMLLVPWDNDGFVRYACCYLNTNLTSYEATAVYNGESRNGLVIGSISHDIWKSAIYIKASGNKTIEEVRCYSGASSDLTRDMIPHGKISGKSIYSAKMLVGFFDDWRIGMEMYGYANTLIAPSHNTWKRGTPMGWNSWGVIMEHINYTNTNEISAFYKNELYPRGFYNEQENVIVDLDSFWAEGLPSDAIRKQFAASCKDRNQIPGIYWGPFAHWGGLDNYVEFTNNKYRFRDCVIRANGEPATLDGAYCLDPTHPAVKERISKMFAQFKDWGYEYVKLDFVNFGAVQSDSYYNNNVTTAIQAYNEGMQHLLNEAGDDMFIALSIAPIFPYSYANSRRISCDAWGTIGHTEYVMNALSYGWWTNRFYQYNDPDHVVLQRENESEGANRARITSAVITGMFLMGDNFSVSYTQRGNPAVSKARALSLATNPGILDIARLGTSFMPVYGHKISETTRAENLFMHPTDDCLYIACINYNPVIRSISGSIPLAHLDLQPTQIESIEELWTGEKRELKNDEITYAVPPCDARVYRITKKNSTAVFAPEKADNLGFSISNREHTLFIQSPHVVKKIELYNSQGWLLSTSYSPGRTVEIDISHLHKGVYIVKCYFENQHVIVKKYTF
jgi:alpha-galactosidase